MKIQLVDRNAEMCKQWATHFEGTTDVTIHQGDFFGVPTDCVVSPANSYGFMDGGLDWWITKKLGGRVQAMIQKMIAEKYDGELLVGQAVLVETGNTDIPFCISAPTMRVPLILNDSPNVYLAARATFLKLKKSAEHLNINSITISGMGTGVGKVPFDVCAKQMRKAYDDFWLGQYTYPISWHEAQTRHQLLYTDQTRDLQR
jgi:O-acetyl-ADP-ribose deacetylase (regulator of RNase III)